MTYDDLYWHAVDSLCMPPKEAHEWAEKQMKEFASLAQ